MVPKIYRDLSALDLSLRKYPEVSLVRFTEFSFNFVDASLSSWEATTLHFKSKAVDDLKLTVT